MNSENILEVKNLSTSFFYEKKEGKAVDNVSFNVRKGEILGIVGESGSGKSVTAMSIMQLIKYPPGKIMNGEIIFKGEQLLAKNVNKMQRVRGKHISMVFQEPMTSLNPVLTIGEQIAETICQHEGVSKKEAFKRAKELLEIVKIPLAGARLKEYPHQLSGGMRQRVMIAIALSCNPDLIIADEPTTALDVTIQSQILELLRELRKKFNMSIIIITHDIGIVAEMADKVLVMYAGRLAEYGEMRTILKDPKHPYTVALFDTIPKVNEEKKVLNTIQGAIPSIYQLPAGCNFSPRCKFAKEICKQKKPEPILTDDNRIISCWCYEPASTGGK